MWKNEPTDHSIEVEGLPALVVPAFGYWKIRESKGIEELQRSITEDSSNIDFALKALKIFFKSRNVNCDPEELPTQLALEAFNFFMQVESGQSVKSDEVKEDSPKKLTGKGSGSNSKSTTQPNLDLVA